MLLDIEAPDTMAQPDAAGPAPQPQPLSEHGRDEEEAADFIRRNVLEKDATFNDG
jgi:hypothetical protein